MLLKGIFVKQNGNRDIYQAEQTVWGSSALLGVADARRLVQSKPATVDNGEGAGGCSGLGLSSVSGFREHGTDPAPTSRKKQAPMSPLAEKRAVGLVRWSQRCCNSMDRESLSAEGPGSLQCPKADTRSLFAPSPDPSRTPLRSIRFLALISSTTTK